MVGSPGRRYWDRETSSQSVLYCVVKKLNTILNVIYARVAITVTENRYRLL